MKAVMADPSGEANELVLSQTPRPKPAANELLVKIYATALNRADLLQRRGSYPPPPGASPILGLEMAGIIVATGKSVTKWTPGQRVCSLLSGGGYAQYVVIHEDMALPIPANMRFEEAAAIPEAFLTATQALFWLAKLQKRERVLIHAGASGVGTAAIQLARQQEAEVLVTASAPKHALCRNLGAVHVIDYKEKDFAQVIGAGSIDVLLDFIGAPYWQRNLRVLQMDGRLVLLGLMGGYKVEGINLARLLQKHIQILTSTLRSRPLSYKISLTQYFRQITWSKFKSRELKAVIDCVIPWDEVAEAHLKMERNENKGKIVLRVG